MFLILSLSAKTKGGRSPSGGENALFWADRNFWPMGWPEVPKFGRVRKIIWFTGKSPPPHTDRRFEQNSRTLASVLSGGTFKICFLGGRPLGTPFGRLTRPLRRSFGRGLNVGPCGGGGTFL